MNPLELQVLSIVCGMASATPGASAEPALPRPPVIPVAKPSVRQPIVAR